MQIANSSARLPASLPQRNTALSSQPQPADESPVSILTPARATVNYPEMLLSRQADAQRNSEIIERNPRNRNALQAYFDNSTAPAESGVELVGIDTYI